MSSGAPEGEGMLKSGRAPGGGNTLKPGGAQGGGSAGVVFRAAVKADLPEIAALIRAAVDAMEAQGIFQWDSVYPSEEVFQDDIEKAQLFAAVDVDAADVAAADVTAKGAATENDTAKKITTDGTSGVIAAVYVVNCECDEQYRNADWKSPDDSFRVIHRLCVHPKYQHRGLGKEILDHIESDLRCQGVRAIRLDAFSRNPYALSMYRNQGYTMTGTADWRKGRFYLMEKLL